MNNIVETYFKPYAAILDKQLDALLEERPFPYQSLFKAARYSILGHGKRLRPILTIATTEVLNGNIQAAIIPACALEMIHTYSLIHDDLPCMDNDDYRRGKPTVHKAFNEAHALLTGDFLLTYAFEILTEAPHLTEGQRLKLVQVLSAMSGAHGMIGGQVMDMEATNQEISYEQLRFLQVCKTGSLITAAIEFAAIISNASHEVSVQLSHFAHDIGFAFQIIDDILDVTAPEEKHGTKHSTDQQNNKATYVTLLGMEKAQQAADQLLQSAIQKLQQLPCNDVSLLANIAEFIVTRKS